MNIAICDDDIEFCTTLKRQLTDCLQYNDIIDIYYSGEMFLTGCKKCNYDAVFLDLYMGGMTGFETAEKLAHCRKETNIIFLTSNDLMVYDSFEYQPFYFLRKAQYQQVLPKVISKLKGKLKQNGIVQFDIYGSSESIAVSSIIYIQSDNHYIIIHTNKYDYEIRNTLSQMEKQLLSYDFVKIHKKYIVNLKYIKRIHIAEEKILLDNGVELEISRRNKTNVLKKNKEYKRTMVKV